MLALKTTQKKAEQELLQAIVDIEKKLDELQLRKRQTMERYMGGELDFDEYKSLLEVHNEKLIALDGELMRKKTRIGNRNGNPRSVSRRYCHKHQRKLG